MGEEANPAKTLTVSTDLSHPPSRMPEIHNRGRLWNVRPLCWVLPEGLSFSS